METNTINSSLDAILKKKTEGYGSSEMENFSAPGEITVTITLEEYRKLVENNATRKYAIDQANDDRYQRNEEIKAKAAEIESLKAENYELKKKTEALSKESMSWEGDYRDAQSLYETEAKENERLLTKVEELEGDVETLTDEADQAAIRIKALEVELKKVKAAEPAPEPELETDPDEEVPPPALRFTVKKKS